jgi:single-strand DNA-binding protein
MSDITTVGNVGEPALKFTPQGKPVLEFSLAENHSKKNAQGGWDEDGTTWRRVTIWDKKAEALGEVLRKGDRVIVTGSERLREYTAKDGTQGKSLEINARDVGIIPRVQQQAGGQSQQASGNWGAPPAQQTNAGGWGNGPTGADQGPPF